MHEREGAAQNILYLYRLIDLDMLGSSADALPELLLAAERMGFNGLNITYPCKQSVLPHLTRLSDDARALGAVNTIVLRDGERLGHNTDWWGFAEAFKQEMPSAELDRVVLLGAGGAGSAVAHALLTLGVKELAIVDVEHHKAAELADSLCSRFGSSRATSSVVKDVISDADGVVNATPVGMAKLPGTPIERTLLRPAQWVADIIYFPLETELLRHARALGCRTMGGGGMAVFQAVKAFELIVGRPADARRMQRHFSELCSAAASPINAP